jgi:hypothetical protein
MVKMEICFDSEDQQISKLSESSLIAYRIRKAGCDTRLKFGKFKSNKPSFGGGGSAKVFPPTSKEVPSATNGSSNLPTQEGITQDKRQRTRLHLANRRNVNLQARKRKRPPHETMENRKKAAANDHLHRSDIEMSQCNSQRA